MAEGRKDDSGKLRMDLLSTTSLRGLAGVLTFGAAKYDDRNWENGIPWNRVYAAVLRHLASFWDKEDVDPESGLLHIDHAACGVHFLQHYARHRREFDNRPTLEKVVDHVQETVGISAVTVPDGEYAILRPVSTEAPDVAQCGEDSRPEGS